MEDGWFDPLLKFGKTLFQESALEVRQPLFRQERFQSAYLFLPAMLLRSTMLQLRTPEQKSFLSIDADRSERLDATVRQKVPMQIMIVLWLTGIEKALAAFPLLRRRPEIALVLVAFAA